MLFHTLHPLQPVCYVLCVFVCSPLFVSVMLFSILLCVPLINVSLQLRSNVTCYILRITCDIYNNNNAYYNIIYNNITYNNDRLCGLVARVPGYTTEMYCVSCEARTEFVYAM
jgi:hypothetical protein